MRRRGEFKRSQPGKRKKNYSLRHLLNYFLSNNIQRLILSVFSSETLNILKYDLCCVSAKLRTFLLVDSQVQDLYFFTTTCSLDLFEGFKLSRAACAYVQLPETLSRFGALAERGLDLRKQCKL